MTAVPARVRYFLGDAAAAIASGALAASLASWMVPAGWHPLAGMAVGMLAGMALSVPCALAASQVLGMIEPMLQIMLACMVAGMAGGMQSPAESAPGLLGWIVRGALCGLAASAFCALADLGLRRRGGE